MFRISAICFTVMCGSFLASADESPVPLQQLEPRIHSRFFCAEAVHAFPKLSHLRAEDYDFNKILFKLEGYPIDKELIFEIKRPLSDQPDQYQQVMTFRALQDGTYLIDNQNRKVITLSSKGFLPGERVTYRIRTAEGSVNKEVTGLPSPAIFRDDEGHAALRAELISISPTVYAIDLPLMKDGEDYEMKSTSIGDITKAKSTYSSTKPFHYSPATKCAGGYAVLEIKRKSGELYYIELPWGGALEPYRKGLAAFPAE